MYIDCANIDTFSELKTPESEVTMARQNNLDDGQIHVRLTPEEKRKLISKAEQNGYTISAFLRAIANGILDVVRG